MSTLALLYAPSGATGSTGTLLRLPCPGSAPQQYILMSDMILETHWYKATHSSWFVDNTVLSDGGLHLITPVDPLFFVLQHLWPAVRLPNTAKYDIMRAPQGQSMYCDAEQLLSSDSLPDLARLTVADAQLQCLCDTKDIGDGSMYYRFNADKAVAWCESMQMFCLGPLVHLPARVYCKATQAADALAAVRSCAHMDTRELLASGLELVAAYTPAECVAQVRAVHGIAPAETPAPLAVAPSGAPSPKRIKVRSLVRAMVRPSRCVCVTQLDPKDLQKRRAAEARSEAKAAQIAKETRGMKKISAFFAAPPQGNKK